MNTYGISLAGSSSVLHALSDVAASQDADYWYENNRCDKVSFREATQIRVEFKDKEAHDRFVEAIKSK